MITFKQFIAEAAYLRTAIRHDERVYKGDQGEEHYDLARRLNIPQPMYFQGDMGYVDKMYGYVDASGKFLNRKRAFEYARDNGLLKKKLMYADQNDDILVSPHIKKRSFQPKRSKTAGQYKPDL